MELKDQIRINAPRIQVFAALNDPDILRQAIPGCEELEALSPTEFAAVVSAKVGPLKARFKGQVAMADIVAPVSYTLSGEGKGGPAGHAKIRSRVELEEDGAGTVLKYDVKADIGGKLAQLGGHLVQNTANKLAAEFFQNFERLLAPAGAEDAAGEPVIAPTSERSNLLLWVAAGVAALLVLVWLVL